MTVSNPLGSSSPVLTPLYGYYAALANAANARCDVLMVGDSIMEGNSALNISSRWVNLAQTALRAKYGPATQGPGFIPAQYFSSYGSAQIPWAFAGSTTNAGFGFGFKGKQLNAAATATITQTCTSFKLLMSRQAADAVTITIDGGAPATWTLVTSGAIQQTWSSGALAAAAHTIVVSRTAGGPVFTGGMFYNGDETSGVALWDGSRSGAKTSDFSTANTDWIGCLSTQLTPSLIVLGCATNDCRVSGGGYSAATFQTNTQSIVTAVRAKVASVPILLMPPYMPLGTLIEPWGNYIAALRAVVSGNSFCALYDMSAEIPDLTSDPYSFLADGVHPTTKGHALLAPVAQLALEPH